MRVLQINKFLYPKGGAEEYMFQLASLLRERDVECSFWGMADDRNIVADEQGCFADNVDFHALKGAGKAKGLINTIYSAGNVQKIGCLLDAYKPDIAHIHNYNYQLTPAILPAIKRRGIKVVHTAHDSQIICPYHRFYNFQKRQLCVECVNKKFYRCAVNRCFDSSLLKSVMGMTESYLYHGLNYYNKYIDAIISPSKFLAAFLQADVRIPVYVVPNCTREYSISRDPSRGEYILYFGRISKEKGILDLLNLPVWNRYRLVIIGDGPDTECLGKTKNIEYLGFKEGEELRDYIANARYVIQPSQWYENCPMTVIESFMCGTPVIAANCGGFVEMIKHGVNGFLIDFQHDLSTSCLAEAMAMDPVKMREQCRKIYSARYAPEVHIRQIMNIYRKVLS